MVRKDRGSKTKDASPSEVKKDLSRLLSEAETQEGCFELRAHAERIAAMTPKRKRTDGTVLLRRDRRR
jgi:hypothetical protein